MALGPIIKASWDGYCAECGDKFYEDDDIRYHNSELIGQDCCGEAAENEQREEREEVF